MVKWFILPVEKKTVPRPSLTGGFCTLTGVPKVLNMNLYIPWKNTSRDRRPNFSHRHVRCNLLSDKPGSRCLRLLPSENQMALMALLGRSVHKNVRPGGVMSVFAEKPGKLPTPPPLPTLKKAGKSVACFSLVAETSILELGSVMKKCQWC